MSYCSSSASAFGLGLPQYGLSSSSYGLSTSLYGSPHSLPLSYPLSLHSAPFGYPTGHDSLAHQSVSCAAILLTSTATQWQPTSLGRFTRPTRTSAPARDPGSPLTPSDRTDMPAAPAAAAASLGRPPSTRRRSDTDSRRTPRPRRSTSLPCPSLGPVRTFRTSIERRIAVDASGASARAATASLSARSDPCRSFVALSGPALRSSTVSWACVDCPQSFGSSPTSAHAHCRAETARSTPVLSCDCPCRSASISCAR